MITLKNVAKRYPPDQFALQGLDLQVADGEFIFVAGASGAGKSTLLRVLSGMERASRGEVVVRGRNLMDADLDEIQGLRREVGFIFQDYRLLPRRTVLENVAFGLEISGVRYAERMAVAAQFLEAVGLKERLHFLPEQLSGGEQQRVAIARALVHHPRLILADEPTGNLDPEMSRLVFDLLLEANAAGVTVLVATHNLGMIEDLNLRTVVLEGGRVIGDFARPRGGTN